MPKNFDNCVAKNGRMFTIKIGKDKYRHGCEIGGKTFYGEIMKKMMNKKEMDKRMA